MSATNYTCRLFGGRNLGVAYDPVAGTLSIMNQSLLLSTVPAALVTNFQNAVANAPATRSVTGAIPAFGGDNVAHAVGEILDSQPTWRQSVQTAIAAYVSTVTHGGLVGDPETAQR